MEEKYKINEYTYSDINVGDTESFQVIVSEDMLNAFRSITGDYNPLHQDDSFAQEMGYSSHVAFGMLTSSFLSTLAGVYLPGKYSLIHEVSCKMTKPVQVGDSLNIVGQVIDKAISVNRLEIKVTITNQNGDKVLRGNMKVGVMK